MCEHPLPVTQASYANQDSWNAVRASLGVAAELGRCSNTAPVSRRRQHFEVAASIMKSLDRKLAAIHADPQGASEFILADAKDADMAFGIGAPGKSPERHDAEVRFRTLAEYREQMPQIVRQGLVDILLMSASTAEVLALQERLFDDSDITPAMRANDATDIHAMRGSRIPQQPAKPFRTASIDHAQCGHLDCDPSERNQGVDLGLYSVTFNNDVDLDRETLLAYNEFRLEAERKGFRHFLEVFNPNLPGAIGSASIGEFLVDAVAHTLAGVTSRSASVPEDCLPWSGAAARACRL